MKKEIFKEPKYIRELLKIMRSNLPEKVMFDKLCDYHENDIAVALEQLTPEERKKLYSILGPDKVADIFTYLEDIDKYLKELKPESAAKVISHMDSDDAVDALEEMDDITREKLVNMLDDKTGDDVRLILSYDEDEIGSYMTTNFIVICNKLTVRQAMHELVRQARDNDNISTIYVVDEKEHFYGAIDLKDLIIAREHVSLEDLISTSYPYVADYEKIGDCIERIKDYAEDSIPVLNEDGHILGVITAQDIVEVVDDEMGDDYAKLAGLTAEEDLKETVLQSMKKRLPWLVVLLFLGMGVSSVVGAFEVVATALPVLICFQSLILDMAGNVGTQSLAVTIRVLMDENLAAKQKISLVCKEMEVAFFNGILLALMSLIFLGLYVFLFKGYSLGNAFIVSGCVGIALIISMVISGMVGTLTPMLFHKIKIDPAVASGPLITTVNDLVAVVTYYGLAWILLINVLNMA